MNLVICFLGFNRCKKLIMHFNDLNISKFHALCNSYAKNASSSNLFLFLSAQSAYACQISCIYIIYGIVIVIVIVIIVFFIFCSHIFQYCPVILLFLSFTSHNNNLEYKYIT